MWSTLTLGFALFSASVALAAPDITRSDAPISTGIINPPGVPVDAPPQFNITDIGVNGSGCPPGSAYHVLNAARTAVTVTFSEYYASAGPGILPTENRKNCQVSLGVHVPQGFSFAIVTVDYRGFYQLDENVNGFHRAVYYFQGQLVEAEAETTLPGPVSGDNYVFRDQFDLTPTVYSPCGEDTVLNINSAVRVDNFANRAGFGFIVNDSLDAHFNQTFNFSWLTCP